MTHQGKGRHLVALSTAVSRTDIAQRARDGQAEALARCRERRERVLRHPDLAARLTQPPLNHSDPAMWNGYVPPATWGDYWSGKHGEGKPKPNNSPERAALVDICAEALRRESSQDREQ